MECQVFASATRNTVEEQYPNGEAIELSIGQFITCVASNHMCRNGGVTPSGSPLWMVVNRRPLSYLNGRPC